jgi:hypothetical protein
MGYTGADCSKVGVFCCQYCIPDKSNPGHYKPASWMAVSFVVVVVVVSMVETMF